MTILGRYKNPSISEAEEGRSSFFLFLCAEVGIEKWGSRMMMLYKKWVIRRIPTSNWFGSWLMVGWKAGDPNDPLLY